MENNIENTQSELINRYKQILENKFPEFPDKELTFLEVIAHDSKETTISSMYSFFLENGNHRLGRLFLNSLLEIANRKSKKSIDFEKWEVYQEVVTKNNKRIDIVVEELNEKNSKALIIENKIYAPLYNDLNEYWNYYDIADQNKIGIVLSLESISVKTNNFINITHKEYLYEVRKNLGFYFTKGSNKAITLLKDFMESMDEFYNLDEGMKNKLQYYISNYKKIEELVEIQKEAKNHFFDSIDFIADNSNSKYKVQSRNPKDHRILSILNHPDCRFWINFAVGSEFSPVTVYLEFDIKYKDKVDLILNDSKVLAFKSVDLKIELIDESHSFITIAEKGYNFTAEEFVNLGPTLLKRIDEDWDKLISLIVEINEM